MKATRAAGVLAAAADRAASSSPYYRRTLAARSADWRSTPFTLPSHLLRYGPEFAARDSGGIYASSGTSGRAKPAFFTGRDRAATVRRTIASLVGSGVRTDDVLVVAHGFGIWLIGTDFTLAGEELGLRVLPVGKGPSVTRSIQLMREYGASVVATSPSYARRLAITSGSEPGRLADQLGTRMLLLSGETVSARARAAIAEAWGVADVRTYYGTAELGHLGSDPGRDGVVHLSAEFAYEILRDGQPADITSGARGELVVTTLFHEGMPLVRYRTGDIVEVVTARTRGDVVDLSVRVLGRLESSVVLESGEKLWLWQLEELLLGNAGVVDFRAEVDEVAADRMWFPVADRLTVRISTVNDERPEPDHLDSIVEMLSDLSLDVSAAGESLRFALEWVTHETLIAGDGDGKPRRLVDRRTAGEPE